MPPDLKVRVEDVRFTPPPSRPLAADPARRFQSVAAGIGSEVLVSLSPIPWLPRLSWNTRIIEFEWFSHFTDEQTRGPFALFRHRHGIAAEIRDSVEGTAVTDAIDYELPFGILGKLAATKARRKFEESFPYRQKRLPEVLAAASRQAGRKA